MIKPNEKGSNLHESKNKHLFGIGLTIGIFLALCLACQGLMTLSQPAINMQKTSLPAAASDSDNSDPIGDEWPMFHGSLNGTGGINIMPMLKGELLWNYTTGSAIDSSPAIVGNCLYIGSSDSHLYCLNAVSGLQIWNFTGGSPIDNSPIVTADRIYIEDDVGTIYCLNATTGIQMWNFSVVGDLSFIPSGRGGLRIFWRLG